MSELEQSVWCLLDDRAGNRAQALGVAERLGLTFREVELGYGPLAKLPNLMLGASTAGLDRASVAGIGDARPSLVIAAGRRTAPVARWIKRTSGNGTRLVQIMDPGAGRGDFDLICRPAHDGGTGATNTMTIKAAPHRMTRARLDDAADIWRAALDELPSPKIAVLIGGSTRRRRFTEAMAETLIDKAKRVASDMGGSLMVTTSRRTGNVLERIERLLEGPHKLHRWDSADANPYAGYLALADMVIVTGESVSMCSEACAVGKPAYIFAPDDLITGKHRRMLDGLTAGGHVRMLSDNLDLDWTPAPLDTAEDIVAEIKRRGLLVTA